MKQVRAILVTGAGGQLGSELRTVASSYPHFTFVLADRKELDITDADAIQSFLDANPVDAIINCAAYTAVDRAESEPEAAFLVNAEGPKNLALIAKERGLKLVHLSTDYVFSGQNFRPYTETDPTGPISVYGQSKLEGERAVLAINPADSVIIRTSWLYSSFGNNFVKTMLRLGKEKEKIGVVWDQVGTPTYARDLARTVLKILPSLQTPHPEIYHYSNEGVLSWYDFAKEIMRMAKLPCRIDPILTAAYPTPAKRPHYSLLNKSKIKTDFDIEIPYWKDSLAECLVLMGERR